MEKPATKDAEYYAAKGVRYEEGFYTNSRGMKLGTTMWVPSDRAPKALICLLHGYGMDCTIFWSEVGERLAAAGYATAGIDYEGHGRSDGLRAYIPDFDKLVEDCIAYFRSVRETSELRGLPAFLFGESMGGAVTLLLHRREPSGWDGAVLVAPMCKIADEMKPPALVTAVLTRVAYVLPTWKVLPTRDIIEAAFKDPVKRERIRQNPYAYQDKPRLGTGLSLLKASNDIEAHLEEVSLPFLVLHGEADTVTDPAVSQLLHAAAKSPDKAIITYPDMWHGLLEGEPDDNVERVYKDIFAWLEKRSARDSAPKSSAEGVAAMDTAGDVPTAQADDSRPLAAPASL